MNKILLPLLALILVACASPKVTVVSEVTVTSSPPTATPIPTPTLHPQFVALQESIAASGERFTLLPDGTIQDGATVVPGLSVDKTGAITLRGLSSQVALDAADVSFDDEKGVSVKGYTLDEATGKWAVERPIKEFPWCKDMHLFEQCVIDPADLQEQGRYAQSTLTEGLFDPAQVNFVPMTPMSTFNLMNATFLTPNIETVPNYKIEATRPFKNQYMFGKTTIDGVEQYVIQVPYYIEGVVAQNFPVITGVNPVGAGGYKNSKAGQYLTQMNVPVWNITDLSLAIQYPNPKTGVNFTMEEVQTIVEEMKVGNFANTDGLVLNFLIGGSTDGWFR